MNRFALSSGIFGSLAALAFIACATFGGEEGSSSSSSSGSSGPNGNDGGPVVSAMPGSLKVTFASPVRLVAGASVKVHVKLDRGTIPGTVSIVGKNLPEGVGVVQLDLPEGVSEGDLELNATATAKQGDAKGATVVARATTSSTTADSAMGLFVRGAPGTLDTTYATNGSLVLGATAGARVITATSPSFVYFLIGDKVRRMTVDGQLDASYAPAPISNAIDLAINGSDDTAFVYKIVSPNAFATKLTKTGALDTAYGNGGTSEELTPLFSQEPTLLAVTNKNEVIAAHTSGTTRHTGNLTKGTTAGARDQTFTFDSHSSANSMFGHTDVTAILPRADGSAFVVTDDNFGPTILDRIGANGATLQSAELGDASFSNPREDGAFLYLLTYVPDGDRAIVRYDAALAKDTAFGVDGVAKLPAYPNIAGGDGMGFAFDGQKRIVAACFTTFAGTTQLVLSRFLPNGTIDKTFDPSGFHTTPSAISSSLSIFASDPERVLIVGARGTEAFIARFWM